jgi:hypothetical protein
MSKSERKITNCYTCLECKSCKNISKRKFESGDCVFQNMGKCSECDGNLIVTMIFGEIIE